MSKSKVKSRDKQSSDIKNNVAVVDVDEGFVELKLYAGLQTYFNNKIKTIKGAFNRVNQKENRIALNKNKKELRKIGIKIESKAISKGAGHIMKDQMFLPIVWRKTMKDGRTVILQLVKYQKDCKYQKDVDMNIITSKDESEIWGNYAVYKIIENGPAGSKDQNPIGFLFGERPGKTQIDIFEENKRDAFDILMEEDIDIDEENIVMEDEIDEEDVVMEEEDITTPTLGMLQTLSKESESIEDQLEVTPEDTLRDFYNNLSDEEVITLASKLNIDNAEDLISIFNKTPFIMTTDEYIENIKKCYF